MHTSSSSFDGCGHAFISDAAMNRAVLCRSSDVPHSLVFRSVGVRPQQVVEGACLKDMLWCFFSFTTVAAGRLCYTNPAQMGFQAAVSGSQAEYGSLLSLTMHTSLHVYYASFYYIVQTFLSRMTDIKIRGQLHE